MEVMLPDEKEFLDDHLLFACPVIAQFILNWDASLVDNESWDFWMKPFIPLLSGSRVLDKQGRIDVGVLKERLYICADSACREFAPLYLEAATETLINAGLLDEVILIREHAYRLYNLEPVTAATAAASILALEEAITSTTGAAKHCIRSARGPAALLAAKNAGWALRCTVFAIKAAKMRDSIECNGYAESNCVAQSGRTAEESRYLFNTMRADLLHRMLKVTKNEKDTGFNMSST